MTLSIGWVDDRVVLGTDWDRVVVSVEEVVQPTIPSAVTTRMDLPSAPMNLCFVFACDRRASRMNFSTRASCIRDPFLA
jgi:hypothetical protein